MSDWTHKTKTAFRIKDIRKYSCMFYLYRSFIPAFDMGNAAISTVKHILKGAAALKLPAICPAEFQATGTLKH
jgi:hypothetical protein